MRPLSQPSPHTKNGCYLLLYQGKEKRQKDKETKKIKTKRKPSPHQQPASIISRQALLALILPISGCHLVKDEIWISSNFLLAGLGCIFGRRQLDQAPHCCCSMDLADWFPKRERHQCISSQRKVFLLFSFSLFLPFFSFPATGKCCAASFSPR